MVCFKGYKLLRYMCAAMSLMPVLAALFCSLVSAAQGARQSISLNSGWLTIATDSDRTLPSSPAAARQIPGWKKVDVPHNWDSYEGYRRLLHGNRHGEAWYVKTFSAPAIEKGKRCFLFFEGAGSYATVYLNDKYVGYHAGGRTTFTFDVTDQLIAGRENRLAIYIQHPSGIRDLPWVCGGCSEERGFSEGSQPMGIFRPVHLVVTGDIRIEPFGVHAWSVIQKDVAELFIETTVRNYSTAGRNVHVTHELLDAAGHAAGKVQSYRMLAAGDSVTLEKVSILLKSPGLWSPEDPYLYRIISTISENGRVIDRIETEFGFRTISWTAPSHQFLVNGQPVFINGVAEYEHLLGQSHAFSDQQIKTRMKWLRSAGFNAFRDGHQPHNLLYGQMCNRLGLLWWTQLSAHVWYDTPEFRKNFMQLLREWVIERRNDPAVILWGLQNESKIPVGFATECTDMIRDLDPTASSQRLVTTCNGGSGTDWDVPQNWTGTYGGDPATYANDIKKQVLVGEYGAWRTIGLHAEGGYTRDGTSSEDRMTQLMEMKIRLAESVKDSVAGQFFWLLTSHDNPGRVQGGEGLREPDRIGPVNYKGLLTPWEEPTDAYYMYRSNYAPVSTGPMVYIVSHTWPNRWLSPGIKDSIIVYSNCEEVELFNDIDGSTLGKRKRDGAGSHFQWDKADIRYNVLYAKGYRNGKVVARDTIVLHHLPIAPHFHRLLSGAHSILSPEPGYHYISRINCGGDAYTDEYGNQWSADRERNKVENIAGGSSSWANDFPGMPRFFASQRRTFSPVRGTRDWELFQTFRYGRDRLNFSFALPDGEYLVELFFIEPWLGIGGGMDARGMRLFDVAMNGKTVLHDLDIWKEAGTNSALKKSVRLRVTGGKLVISFPRVASGQALIAAIAIAGRNKSYSPKENTARKISPSFRIRTWTDIGDSIYTRGAGTFHTLPPYLFGADRICFPGPGDIGPVILPVQSPLNLFVAMNKASEKPVQLSSFENTGAEIVTDENGGREYAVFRKMFAAGDTIRLAPLTGSIIAMQPVSQMQPAYDLKPVTAYRAPQAILSDGVAMDSIRSRAAAVVRSGLPVSLTWPVQTGLADIYSITVKYYSPVDMVVHGRVQLEDQRGIMLLDIAVNFNFTAKGKWNQFTVNTGSMINAGNYKVRLLLSGAAGIAFSGIEVQ